MESVHQISAGPAGSGSAVAGECTKRADDFIRLQILPKVTRRTGLLGCRDNVVINVTAHHYDPYRWTLSADRARGRHAIQVSTQVTSIRTTSTTSWLIRR